MGTNITVNGDTMSNLHEMKKGLRSTERKPVSDQRRKKAHNHYPQGKTGYVLRTIDNSVRL